MSAAWLVMLAAGLTDASSAASQVVGAYEMIRPGAPSVACETMTLNVDHSFRYNYGFCNCSAFEGTWQVVGDQLVLTGETRGLLPREEVVLRFAPIMVAEHLFLVRVAEFNDFSVKRRLFQRGQFRFSDLQASGLQRVYRHGRLAEVFDSWKAREAELPIGYVTSRLNSEWVLEGFPESSVNAGDLLIPASTYSGGLVVKELRSDGIIGVLADSDEKWKPVPGNIFYSEKMLHSRSLLNDPNPPVD